MTVPFVRVLTTRDTLLGERNTVKTKTCFFFRVSLEIETELFISCVQRKLDLKQNKQKDKKKAE